MGAFVPAVTRWAALAVLALVTAAGLGVLALRGEPPAPLPQEPFTASAATDGVVTADVVTTSLAPTSPAQSSGAASHGLSEQPAADDQQSVAMTPEQMAPGHLFIPSLAVYAPVQDTGVTAGQLVLPEGTHRLARATTSPGLDSPHGSTLIAGHVSVGGRPGALHPIGMAPPGARIYVTTDDGRLTSWRATDLLAVDKGALPPVVWDTDGPRRLVLVTCGGPVVNWPTGRAHRDNVILVAAPLVG